LYVLLELQNLRGRQRLILVEPDASIDLAGKRRPHLGIVVDGSRELRDRLKVSWRTLPDYAENALVQGVHAARRQARCATLGYDVLKIG
ncbi:hypothetical protein, partial [Stenotrophomonas maltophilia]|uniref:hypothetical protein n=1 Tax=Stenotrophomonas maltophilia TaxID=40324 RepID=UPI0013DBC6AB